MEVNKKNALCVPVLNYGSPGKEKYATAVTTKKDNTTTLCAQANIYKEFY